MCELHELYLIQGMHSVLFLPEAMNEWLQSRQWNSCWLNSVWLWGKIIMHPLYIWNMSINMLLMNSELTNKALWVSTFSAESENKRRQFMLALCNALLKLCTQAMGKQDSFCCMLLCCVASLFSFLLVCTSVDTTPWETVPFWLFKYDKWNHTVTGRNI